MRVNPYTVGAAAIPIAPLAEQRRIVARIDELFAEIAEGEAALERARQGLDTWRRALLKAAVTGELTRDWREANRPAETGADLLAGIRAEREALGARHSRKLRGTAGLPLDTSDLPALPEGWVWARLSELGTFGRGKSKHRPRDDPRLYGGDVPFVQTGIVAGAGDYIKTFHQKYSELGVLQSRIWPSGTLCITIAANIAKTAILGFDACFPDSVVGLVPNRGVDGYFIHVWMQTIQSRLEAHAPATAQKNINLEVLHNVAVPLPPPEEQRQIVDRFHGALETVFDCVETVELDKGRIALRQSILIAAFEGRLVPQDPTDEPASVLLARLVTNRVCAAGARGARRTRATAQPMLPGLTAAEAPPPYP
jgi:type I restriction enzyme S subunit